MTTSPSQRNNKNSLLRSPPKLTNRNSLIKYLEIDLWSWLKDIANSLLKINFRQNFQCFTVENLTIPKNTEVAISNAFRTAYPGNIPSGRIITRQIGDANVVDGNSAWTDTQVYLRNASLVNDTIITVIFFL